MFSEFNRFFRSFVTKFKCNFSKLWYSIFLTFMLTSSLAIDNNHRKRWLSLLAQADIQSLENVCVGLGEWMNVPFQWIRPPETGLVMVRGRIGGSGSKFNVGELSITRCAIRLDVSSSTQSMGMGWVKGKNPRLAEMVARLDALLQVPDYFEKIMATVIEPIAAEIAQKNDQMAKKTASTKVDFYTLARQSQVDPAIDKKDI